MNISEKRVLEFKEILEKKKGEAVTYEEAEEGAHNLAGLFEILWKGHQEDQRRKQRLKNEPDGFVLEGSYTCHVCQNTAYDRNHLYTKWGINCNECYAALKNGVIPTYTAFQRESYFLDWELKSDFKIHPQTVRKYVRQGVLKARIILTAGGDPYEYIFLRAENPSLVSRYSPERKSYDRNREKVSARRAREESKKLRAEFEEEKRKLRARRRAV